MKPSSTNNPPKPSANRQARPLAPVDTGTVFILLGVVLAGAWFKYGKHAGAFLRGTGGGRTLRPHAGFLSHLNAPVEIRFYSVLPPDSASEALRDFSGRVDQLLSEFQDANGTEIQVTRNDLGSKYQRGRRRG